MLPLISLRVGSSKLLDNADQALDGDEKGDVDIDAKTKNSRPQKQWMIDRSHELPITRQYQALSLNQSSIYYNTKTSVPNDDLNLVRL